MCKMSVCKQTHCLSCVAGVFAHAVAAWKELSDDQRKQYTDKFSKDGGDEVSLDDLDLPHLPSAALEDAHKVR